MWEPVWRGEAGSKGAGSERMQNQGWAWKLAATFATCVAVLYVVGGDRNVRVNGQLPRAESTRGRFEASGHALAVPTPPAVVSLASVPAAPPAAGAAGGAPDVPGVPAASLPVEPLPEPLAPASSGSDESALFPKAFRTLFSGWISGAAAGEGDAVATSVACKGWDDVRVERIRLPPRDAPRIEKRVQFVINRWDIREESKPVLDDVAALIVRNPGYKILIAGHTDRMTGKDEWNDSLSALRAGAVRLHLILGGVDQGSLKAVGYGSRRLLEPDERTDEARQRNRRVEIINYGRAEDVAE